MTLTYALTGAGRELLRIEGSGIRYLVLQAAHPSWQHRAGLYATGQVGTVTEQMSDVTAQTLAAPVRARRRNGPVLTATDRGRTVTTALNDPDEPAARLLSEAIDLARQSPVQVLSLTAEVINDTDLRLAFTAAGSQEVDLQLRRESCRVSAQVDGTWRSVWSPDSAGAQARLSLVAPPDGFVDGVRTPAVLAPGVVARTMLPGALTGADARASRVIVDIDVTLEIPTTEDLAESDPELGPDLRGRWPVHLTCPVTSRT